MKTKLILILGILLVSLQACQRESEMVAPEIDGNMVAAVSTGSGYSPGDGAIQRPVSKKERVIMNCRTVQAAVEQFAAENGGM